MGKVIIVQKDDYADEFDLEGFMVMDKTEWEKQKRQIEKMEFPTECYFGTNESMEYSRPSDFFLHVKVFDITEEEHAVIRKFFGEYPFGLMAVPEPDWEEEEE